MEYESILNDIFRNFFFARTDKSNFWGEFDPNKANKD